MLGLGRDALDLGSSLSWEVVLGPPPSCLGRKEDTLHQLQGNEEH